MAKGILAFKKNTERMTFLEKDLETIIYETDNQILEDKGLWILGKKFRQLRIGNYGVSDIVSVYRCSDIFGNKYLDITIYELKKEKAGISAFLQAVRYMKGISNYLNKRKPGMYFKFHIVLVSKTIDCTSDYIFLCDFIENENEGFGMLNSLNNYSFSYTVNGIEFKNESGYSLTKEGF